MKNIVPFLLFFTSITIFSQSVGEYKHTFEILDYNRTGNADGYILSDIVFQLTTRNIEKAGYEGKKNIYTYSVQSNVAVKFKVISYRYQGKEYKLTNQKIFGVLGDGADPITYVNVLVEANNSRWQGKLSSNIFLGEIGAFKYEGLKNLKEPFDVKNIAIGVAKITDSRDGKIESKIKDYLSVRKNNNNSNRVTENTTNTNPSNTQNTTTNKRTRDRVLTPEEQRLKNGQNAIDKLKQQQEIDNAYAENVGNAFSESIDSEGNFNAGTFINSLPSATTKTQAYTNLVMSGTAILGQVLQGVESKKEKRKKEIANRRIKLKDGIGKYNQSNNKTGHWSYFYLNTTAPKSSGSYKNGKRNGIWEFYENQEYSYAMDKIMNEVIIYNNGQVVKKYKAENANYSITRETGLFSRKRNFIKQKGNYLIDEENNKIQYGLWEEYNNSGINISTGYYNIKGERTGRWTLGHTTSGIFAHDTKRYKIKAELYFKNGLLEGLQKSYYKNGQLFTRYYSSKGKIHGKSIDYYDDGKLMREEFWVNGIKTEITEYDKKGNVLNNRNLVDLKKEQNLNTQWHNELKKLKEKEIKLYNNSESVRFHNAQFPGPKLIKGELIVKDSLMNDVKVSHYQDEEYKVYDDYLFVKIKNKIAIINSKKEIIIPPEKYDTIIVSGRYFDNVAVVAKNNKYGAINEKGKVLLPLKYDYVGLWSNRTFWVEKDNKLGLISEKGKIVLPIEHEYIGRGWLYTYTKKKFHKNKIARIKKDGKWGWINHLGEIIIEPIYDETWSAELKDSTKVKLNGQTFYIDKKGKRIK